MAIQRSSEYMRVGSERHPRVLIEHMSCWQILLFPLSKRTLVGDRVARVSLPEEKGIHTI